MHQPPAPPKLHWDIFCRVIDNFGDIGVCWRVCVNLAQRGQAVRLWVDDTSALAWMAPNGAPSVQVLTWTTPFDAHGATPGDVLVEAFGCDIAPDFIAAYASRIRAESLKCLWINLEYLSAEGFAARCHGLPSPVMSGPGQGLTKHFFYPGFTADTGGLLREPDLLASQAAFDRRAWLAQWGIVWQGERLVSLFCYEPAGLPDLLRQCAQGAQPTRLLVTAGRASAAVQHWVDEQIRLQLVWNKGEKLLISYLPQLTQTDFDHLLWASDLNLVRGEDSLVRALWACRPLIWHIYPQDDNAHHAKLDAFLAWLEAPASMRLAHARWNDVKPAAPMPALLQDDTLDAWQACVAQARAMLLAQDDLATRLLTWVLPPDSR